MSYYGNEFYITGFSSFYLDDSSEKLSYRFTAPASKTVDKIVIRVASIQGTSPTYRIGIQGNNGGEPDGSWLNGNAYADENTFGVGFQEIDITDAALTQGTVYHIVIEHQTGICDGSNHLRIRAYTSENIQRLPVDNSSDANMNTLTYAPSTWTVLDRDPIVIIVWDDASYALQPYQALLGNKNIYLNDYYGEQIVLGENKTITHVGLRVRTNGTPAGNLLLNIYNVSDTVYVIEDEVIDESITTSYAWVDHELDSPVELVSGKIYQIFLASDSSTDTSNCYQINGPSTTAAYASISFNGITDTYAFTTSGAVPLGVAQTYRDLAYRLTLQITEWFIQSISTDIPYVIRTGSNTIELRVDFIDPEDLDASAYVALFWVREPDNTEQGSYTATVTKESASNYNATYDLDIGDGWDMGLYDLKVEISK